MLERFKFHLAPLFEGEKQQEIQNLHNLDEFEVFVKENCDEAILLELQRTVAEELFTNPTKQYPDEEDDVEDGEPAELPLLNKR